MRLLSSRHILKETLLVPVGKKKNGHRWKTEIQKKMKKQNRG